MKGNEKEKEQEKEKEKEKEKKKQGEEKDLTLFHFMAQAEPRVDRLSIARRTGELARKKTHRSTAKTLQAKQIKK